MYVHVCQCACSCVCVCHSECVVYSYTEFTFGKVNSKCAQMCKLYLYSLAEPLVQAASPAGPSPHQVVTPPLTTQPFPCQFTHWCFSLHTKPSLLAQYLHLVCSSFLGIQRTQREQAPPQIENFLLFLFSPCFPCHKYCLKVVELRLVLP